MAEIVVHQFYPNWGLPNASPFCMKLETYLRMAEIPYSVVYEETLANAPKGKMPYIQRGAEKIGDSNLIIEKLQAEYGDRLDGHLSSSARAIALAFQRMIDENLYWCMVYSRWIDDQAWQVLKEAYFSKLPPVVKQILPELIRRDTRKSLHGHGMGRHNAEEVYAIGCRDLQALSDFLGDQPFFGGDRPITLDASAYATVRNFLEAPLPSPLQAKAQSLSNLQDFCHRMTDRYYPPKSAPA
jgi:glutathione S-transferase